MTSYQQFGVTINCRPVSFVRNSKILVKKLQTFLPTCRC